MRRRVSAAILTLFLAAGCSSGPGSIETIAPPSTPTAAPTATVAPTSNLLTPPPPTYTTFKDIPFMTVDGTAFLLNVYQPVGDGPFPVVVAFHGFPSKEELSTVAVAEQAASSGMVVFTPTWITDDQLPFTADTFATWEDITICAVAFAQQMAPQYKGDAATTIVDGFSAGAGGALVFASAQPRTDPVRGCVTDALPRPVKGFVLGDGEYLLHTENFDQFFSTDPERAQARVASLIAPSLWSANPDAKFYLWVAAEGTNPRPIGDPSSGWFAQRDPDGSIKADLERLDEFADGVMTYVDAGKLVALRLSRAGFQVTLDEYSGGHTTMNKLAELVGDFEALVGE